MPLQHSQAGKTMVSLSSPLSSLLEVEWQSHTRPVSMSPRSHLILATQMCR